MAHECFQRLSERQRDYLRKVFQHLNSEEIAFGAGVSSRAVDKQLLLAKNIIGANSRFEAARKFAEYEAGLEGIYPPSAAPSKRAFWPLPPPLPTKEFHNSSLSTRHVLAWGAIIAVITPIAITVAAMVIISLAILFRVRM